MPKTILLVNALFLSTLSLLCGQEVLIVYYSARGHTAAMAEAVAGGARSVNGPTRSYDTEDDRIIRPVQPVRVNSAVAVFHRYLRAALNV